MAVTFRGVILASAPDYGMALVVPETQEAAVQIKDIVAATLPLPDSDVGTQQQNLYATGTSVTCWARRKGSPMAAIIGAANTPVNTKKTPNKGKMLYDLGKISATDQDSETKILDTFIKGIRQYWKNRSEGVDRDAIAGDTNIVDVNGLAGVHVGRNIASLAAGSMSVVDVSSITNEVRALGEAVKTDTPLAEVLTGTELSVKNIAISVAEAFGIKEGEVLKKDGKDYVCIHEDGIPLYRLQEISGAAADGTEAIVVGFPDKDVHTSATEPPVLARQRRSLSGELSDASAFGITSVKTPLIHAVHQLGYGKKPAKTTVLPDGTKKEAADDLRTPYTYEKQQQSETAVNKTAADLIDDAALLKASDGMLSGDYSEAFKEYIAGHGLSTADKAASLYGKIAEGSGLKKDADAKAMYGHLSGPVVAASYALPKQLTLTDPVTGQSRTYFASESFISQEPDGSILIADGYGSEIRMSRGNIYISSALDTFIRPGRDLSAMTPGHQSFNSQKTCTINSSDSTYIRAVGDLKLAAGSGADEKDRKGSIVVDCMSKNSGDGIILQSKSQLTATGANVYIGRNTQATDSKDSVSEPESSGAIILDSGTNGTIVERSAAHTVESGDVRIAAVHGVQKASMLSVADSRISLYSNSVHAPSVVSLNKMDASPEMHVWKDGEASSIRISVQTAGGALFVPGTVYAKDITVAESAVINKTLAAKSVASMSDIGIIREEDAAAIFKAPVFSAVPAIKSGTDLAVRSVVSFLYCDAFLSSHRFWFPQTYEDVYVTKVPGMRWQTYTRLYKDGNPNVWTESYVKDENNEDTACYPGITAWENATVSTETDAKPPLKSGYIVNTINKNKG